MIHVTRSHRPEVVVFGRNQEFRLPLMLDAGGEEVMRLATGTGHAVTAA